jgi:hypothetical protein
MSTLIVLAATWLVCFALCVYFEQGTLAIIKRTQGRTMAVLFVLSALLTAPVTLGQTLVARQRVRAIETKKL